MRYRGVSAALFLLVGVVGCAKEGSSQATEKSMVEQTAPRKGEIPELNCGNDWPKTEKDGKVLGCVIMEDTAIGKYTCKKMGRVELYDDGRLKECKIAEAKTWPQPTVTCKAGSDMELHETGELKECSFSEPTEISGHTCKYSADFYQDGKLRRCQVSKESKAGDLLVPAGSWLTLTEDGKAKRIEYPEGSPQTFNGRSCLSGYFWEDGSIKICEVAEKLKIKGKDSPVNVRLCWDATGTPSKDIDLVCTDWESLVEE